MAVARGPAGPVLAGPVFAKVRMRRTTRVALA